MANKKASASKDDVQETVAAPAPVKTIVKCIFSSI